ncbi:MAG: TIGR03915 family putative DNA repair protein [Bacteroidales bacterium]|nr:TIGR03915 family putative DNA repair protein [Bacteroidales bacterium]MCL2133183.1 TIGR03915 family putative DNA repair protein [Bacteroidales bacterium]
MRQYRYDNTFEGLLTLVFDAYSRKIFPVKILRPEDDCLFEDEVYTVVTAEDRAQRVWTGLQKKISKDACQMCYAVFLSELPDVELLLLRYMQKAFAAQQSIEVDFGDADVLECSKIYRKVMREAERMRMFVRFQKTADGIFFAPIEPKYNVLPLAIAHFEDRFADQQWIIYDVKRQFGFYYNLHKTEEITFDKLDIDLSTGKLNDAQAAMDELLFQQLWQNYFKSICIKERTNLKLHRQHLPKRFWKFLPEKR